MIKAHELRELWKKKKLCKICNKFTADYNWVIEEKICKKCYESAYNRYQSYVDKSVTLDEYIDGLITANKLSAGEKNDRDEN